MRRLSVTLLLLSIGTAGLALASKAVAPPPPVPEPATAEEAADRVAAAIRRGDSGELRTAALRDDPDGWDVAWTLCARGDAPSARALATAVSPALERAVAAMLARPPPAEICALISQVRSAVDRGDYARAVALVPEPLPAGLEPFTAAKLHIACGVARAGAGDATGSRSLSERGIALAEALGWTDGVVRATLTLAFELSDTQACAALALAKRGEELARGRPRSWLYGAALAVKSRIRRMGGDGDGSLQACLDAARAFIASLDFHGRQTR